MRGVRRGRARGGGGWSGRRRSNGGRWRGGGSAGELRVRERLAVGWSQSGGEAGTGSRLKVGVWLKVGTTVIGGILGKKLLKFPVFLLVKFIIKFLVEKGCVGLEFLI